MFYPYQDAEHIAGYRGDDSYVPGWKAYTSFNEPGSIQVQENYTGSNE